MLQHLPNRAFVVLIAVLTGVHAMPSRAGSYLGDLTWPEARNRIAAASAVIVPFAAGAKQHGPHLPLNTDQRVMETLLARVVEQHDVIVAPPVLHGWLPGFRDYPGTGLDDASVFQDYVGGIARTLARHGARRIVFLNLGITRATGLPLAIVARDLRSTLGLPTLVLSWDDLESDEAAALASQQRGGHADELETSVMLAIDPDAVRMDRAVTDYRTTRGPQIGYAPGHFDFDPDDPASGVYGDPRLASAEKGTKVLQIMTERLSAALTQFAP